VILDGNCARVPINGVVQSRPMPVSNKITAKVVRAEEEYEELVFIAQVKLGESKRFSHSGPTLLQYVR